MTELKESIEDKDNLEVVGCKTFVCPNLILINEKGKELGLSNEIIEKARDMAFEYVKKTYYRPRYSSVTYLLPSFVYIASTIYGNIMQKKRIADVFGVSSATINKWNKDIIDTLKIEINGKSENDGTDGIMFENLVILSENDVIENKSLREREAYNNFDVAFQHAIPGILERIKQSGEIIIRISDIVKELGDKFKNMSDVNIYMGIRHILYKYGIKVVYYTFDGISSHSERMKGLKMRMLEEGDPLPSSIKQMRNRKKMINS